MEQIKVQQVSEWCKGKVVDKHLLKKYCYGVSTDSRKIREGDLFVAIKGGKYDGNLFISDAIKKGATATITDNVQNRNKDNCIYVKNSIQALGDIARGYKNMFTPFTIGVTGSDGKTTTKELVKKVLSLGYKTVANEGNLNNTIGLPLSIFNIDKRDEMCVLEMGMNSKGEIDYLSKIARPDAAIITNVGTAHIGYLNSMLAIAEAKSEIIKNLVGEKLCLLNYDNKFYKFFEKQVEGLILSFGTKKGAHTRGIITEEGTNFFTFIIQGQKEEFKINFWNTTLIYPVLIAYTIAKKFNINNTQFKEIIDSMKPIEGRGLIKKVGNLTVIDESYNCNPNSLKHALDSFNRKDFKKKILIIGDMAELGKLSHILHRNIGLYIKNLKIERLITCGKTSRIISDVSGKRGKHFEDTDSLNQYLKTILTGEETILIKGSRAIGLEKTVKYLTG
ncbi:UDP-N-acetylmuramoyl-tripeptide--D-alanyl-D-alanine ligase [bacterium]|nr:UDP-N-acetylmuramoyl-tripeptide--D-alanyl-D-alanine ligase [bacterium]